VVARERSRSPDPVHEQAERAGIVGPDIERAIDMAEAAGFLVRHVDEPTVMLTAKGLKAGRPSSQ